MGKVINRRTHYGILPCFLFTSTCNEIISDAVAKIPDNEELGEKLIDICLVILGKAVKLTKTDMDDKLLETVKSAIAAKE